MTFSAPISEYVEPAMASASPAVGQEVHGLGYAVSREDADKIDKIEAVPIMHVVNQVTIQLYDGREVQGQIYTATKPIPPSKPSLRYLRILIDGATQAKVDPAYIEKLK